MTTCDRTDCPNEGTHHPVLLLMPKDRPSYTGPPVEMVLGIRVCAPHQADSKPADFIADDGWTQIVHVFEVLHRAVPDRDNVGLVWKRPEILPGGPLPEAGR